MFANRRHAPDLPDPPRRRHRRARPRRPGTGRDQHAAEPRRAGGRPRDGRPCRRFALGLALARPADRVVLFDSEGDLLMSLGILPTVAELAPANFYHFMLDNECYATTGGQPVPNAKNVAYDVIARGARLSARVRLRQARGLRGEHRVHPGPAGARCSWRSRWCRRSRTSRSASGVRWQTRTRDRVLADLRAELGVAR